MLRILGACPSGKNSIFMDLYYANTSVEDPPPYLFLYDASVKESEK